MILRSTSTDRTIDLRFGGFFVCLPFCFSLLVSYRFVGKKEKRNTKQEAFSQTNKDAGHNRAHDKLQKLEHIFSVSDDPDGMRLSQTDNSSHKP